MKPLYDWPELAERWGEFLTRVSERLARGAELGNPALHWDPEQIEGELEEELFDISGWSFILWLRVRALRERTKKQMGEK